MQKQNNTNNRAFRFITLSVLFLLVGSIASLILADIIYVSKTNIAEIIFSPEILSAFFLSITTSLIATGLGILVAVPTAYALSRFSFKGSTYIDVLFDMLIVLPVLVIGVSILVFFRIGSDLGSSSFLPIALIGKGISALSEFFVYRRAGIVLAQFLCSVSFAVRAIKASFDNIDPRTEEVAMTLGCGQAEAFWRISLPLARSGIIAGAVLAWARAFGIFGAISIVAGAVRRKTEVLPTSIYLEISIGRLEAALSISLLMIAVAFFILLSMRLMTGSNIFGLGSRS